MFFILTPITPQFHNNFKTFWKTYAKSELFYPLFKNDINFFLISDRLKDTIIESPDVINDFVRNTSP